MHIVMIGAEAFDGSGGGGAAQRIAETFRDWGCRVTYLAYGRFVGEVRGINVYNAELPEAHKLIKLSAGEQGIAIVIQPRFDSLEMMRVAKRNGFTTVFRVHDDFRDYEPALWYRSEVERQITIEADYGHVVSDHLGKVLEKRHDVRYPTIGNGFTTMNLPEKPVVKDVYNVIFAGWLANPVLDWEFLTELMDISESEKNIRYVFVGGGDKNLFDFSTYFSSFSNCEWTGPVMYAELANRLATADFGLVNMIDHSFSRSADNIKIYEYLAAGIPVLLPEFSAFSDFTAGEFVYKYQNPQDCLRKIKYWIENRPSAQVLKVPLSRFSWNHRVQEILSQISIEFGGPEMTPSKSA